MGDEGFEHIGEAQAQPGVQGVGHAHSAGIYLASEQQQAQQLVELPIQGFNHRAGEAHTGGRVLLGPAQ